MRPFGAAELGVRLVKIICIVASLILSACCGLKEQRTCSISESGDSRHVECTFATPNQISVISFTAPTTDYFPTSEISDYHQKTTYRNGLGWSGGGFEEGFIFINRLSNPESLEIHALQLSDCSCRHQMPYFGNGTYEIEFTKAEQDAAANP